VLAAKLPIGISWSFIFLQGGNSEKKLFRCARVCLGWVSDSTALGVERRLRIESWAAAELGRWWVCLPGCLCRMECCCREIITPSGPFVFVLFSPLASSPSLVNTPTVQSHTRITYCCRPVFCRFYIKTGRFSIKIQFLNLCKPKLASRSVLDFFNRNFEI
jgi:hypothetical protein